MSEYTHKLVDGVLIALTPAEVAEMEADAAAVVRKQMVALPRLDMGQSMNDILTE